MSLPFRPHTVEVNKRVKGQTSGKATSGTLASTVSVQGQLCPAGEFRAIYEQFALDFNNPMVFLCDQGDADEFKIEAEVVYGGHTYVVKADPQVWDAISSISCAAIVLEQVK